MIRHTLLVILAAVCGAHAQAQQAAPISIVTGSERGTYIRIGQDLAKLVAAPAKMNLQVLTSNGSSENVKRLRNEAGVRLALVQSDVYQAFLDEAKAGNQDAARLIGPLKVLMPLYNEELYFVTRADSPLNFVHEIKGKRINVGPAGSGTALSATTVYRQMFGDGIAEKNASFMSNEDALLKLASDNSIDVAVVVAGQPATLFAEMKPQARKYIKLLKVDPAAAETNAVLKTYYPSAIRAASYPAWLTEDVPTLTTKAMLVTYDYRMGAVQSDLVKLVRSLCDNFDRLQSDGHPKWKEVAVELPTLSEGWSYYGPTQRELLACQVERHRRESGMAADTTANPDAAAARLAKGSNAAPAKPVCPLDKKALGLCK
jgi:uncharacterized protein